MAEVVTDIQVFVGSCDMSGFTGEYDPQGETEMKPAIPVAGYKTILPGLSKFRTTLKGQADFASGAVSSTFGPAQKGTQYGVGLSYRGSAATYGDAAVFTRGLLQAMRFAEGPVGDIVKFSMTLESDTAQIPGVVGAPLASRAGLSGAMVALTGPTATQRLWAALFVTEAAGTDLAVLVRSDDQNPEVSLTTRITFSTVSAVGWQFAYVDGNFSTETHHTVRSTVASGTFKYAVLMGVL
jgi:hypothetical protein